MKPETHSLPSLKLSPEYSAAHADCPATPPSGGDFHQAFPLEDGSGNVAVVIGDIAGHGPEQAAQAVLMRELPPRCLVSRLLGRVSAFCRGKFHDDVTVLAIRRLPRSSKAGRK